MKTISNRLYEFITDDQKSTPKKFAQSIGADISEISDIISGSIEEINISILTKIKKKYPQLSIEWLIDGVGDKIKTVIKKPRNSWINRTNDEETIILKPIVKRLIDERESRGLRMEDVAKEIKLSMSGYSALEQGYAKFTVPKLIKLKDFYNISLDYLLLGKIEDPKKIKDLQEANKIIVQQAKQISLLEKNIALLEEIASKSKK